MKLITQALFTLSTMFVPLQVVAMTCPFKEISAQPVWINEITAEEDIITGIGVEQYDPKVHADFFALRTLSELRAKKALTESLSTAIYNSILSNKSLSNGQLVKSAHSVVEQVSELTLPDSQIEARWLDQKNCLLWTQVIVGTEIVNEFIDEIGEMEKEVTQKLDHSLTKSVVESLNAKQFYLNYDGFSKAVSQQAMLTYQGITKPALSWMIDSGFEIFEPSLVHSWLDVDGMSSPYNTSSLEFYMHEEELSVDKMSYILSAFKQSQQSAFDLVTPILHHEGSKSVYSERNPGINFVAGHGVSRIDAPFALGLRFTQDQPFWTLPKVTNVYEQNSSLLTGGFSLLHIATLYKRAALVELLLNEGFDPNFEDVNGMTPAQYAVAIESESLIRLYLDSSKQLDGVYAIAVKKAIYTSNKYLHLNNYSLEWIQTMSTYDGMNYDPKLLKKYKKSFKKKDKKNVKEYKALLKQSADALHAFWKLDKYHYDLRPLTKEMSDANIKRLTDLM